MQLFIKCLTGKTISIDVEPSNNIQDIKLKIENLEEIESKYQEIMGRVEEKLAETESLLTRIERHKELHYPLIDGKKECTICKLIKDINEYDIAGKYITGENKYRSDCHECRNKQKRKTKINTD